MSYRIGSLFSGYGGLEMGVQAALGGTTTWHSEIEAAASRILEHRWPEVPNLGDITAVDWAAVEPVDVLTGGFPCQDVSLAGLRRGLRPDTRSGLWSHFALAIAALRPSLVIVENVRGLLSAEAHSDLESDPWTLGDRRSRPALRALGAVLGDLADLGYDADWCGLRAADAGAPHGRFRVFIVAHPRSSGLRSVLDGLCAGQPDAAGRFAQDADLATGDQRRLTASGEAKGGRAWADAGRRGRASATDSDGVRHPERISGRSATSSAADAGGSSTATDTTNHDSGRSAGARTSSRRAWGIYGPAIARWEEVLGREAPDATEDGRLSPRFVEWMMGLPAGHVTEVGLRRSQQLKALGNGVVPQQAELAVRALLRSAA